MYRVSLHGSPERSLHEAVKARMVLDTPRCWRRQSLRILATESSRPESVCSVEPAQKREVCCRQSTMLKGVGKLKSPLTSDMEMQNLEFAMLVFSFALVH